MKIVCYTCITGGYDALLQPSLLNIGIDFICFSDIAIANSLAWKIRPIPKELSYLSNVKKQRIIKICPHRYLKEYDISIWVDGNIQVVGDMLKFANEYDFEKTSLYTRIHPQRNCIYKEAQACIAIKKDLKQTIEAQVNRYKLEGYPENAGMYETGVILRKHNDMKCQLVCNLWASELLKGSHRDQLSFNYACWKSHFLPGCLKNEFKLVGSNAGKFRLCRHGQ